MSSFIGLSCLAGCASYIPPGAKADLQAFAPASVTEGFAAKATAQFPVGIAFVRVQAPAYTNRGVAQNGGAYGGGRYSVILTREVEDDTHFERVSQLAQVAGVTGLSRLLLPQKFEGDREIREAAARLQAGMVLIYTFDTSFFDTDLSKPLTVITLGLSPTRKVFVTTTVSALLIDTRTGLVYSTYEATKKTETLATSWGSQDSADAARKANERAAFAQLVDEFTGSWPRLLERYKKAA